MQSPVPTEVPIPSTQVKTYLKSLSIAAVVVYLGGDVDKTVSCIADDNVAAFAQAHNAVYPHAIVYAEV